MRAAEEESEESAALVPPPADNSTAGWVAAAGPAQKWYQQLGCRHGICGLTFISGAILQAQRSAPAIAIVRMQSQLGWDKETQGAVLSAFFVGYMAMQIPAGLCTHRLGPHRLIGLAVVSASTISLLLPAAATHSPAAVFNARLAQGLAQGLWSPSLAALWAQWAPPAERSRIDSFPQVGQYFGTLTLGALAGWQCDNPAAAVDAGWLGGWLLGWEGTYRLHGALGLVWGGLWLWFAAASPRSARHCSPHEAAMIERALAAEAAEAAAPSAGGKPRARGSSGEGGGGGAGPGLAGLELVRAVGGAGCVWALMVVHGAANWSQVSFGQCPKYVLQSLSFIADID
eukprot:SAG11_NODE_2763_length_3000_cov_2.151672_2_plen_343_part_00